MPRVLDLVELVDDASDGEVPQVELARAKPPLRVEVLAHQAQELRQRALPLHRELEALEGLDAGNGFLDFGPQELGVLDEVLGLASQGRYLGHGHGLRKVVFEAEEVLPVFPQELLHRVQKAHRKRACVHAPVARAGPALARLEARPRAAVLVPDFDPRAAAAGQVQLPPELEFLGLDGFEFETHFAQNKGNRALEVFIHAPRLPQPRQVRLQGLARPVQVRLEHFADLRAGAEVLARVLRNEERRRFHRERLGRRAAALGVAELAEERSAEQLRRRSAFAEESPETELAGRGVSFAVEVRVQFLGLGKPRTWSKKSR